MPNDNVVRLIQSGGFDDQLTEVLRNGARALLAKKVEAVVADFLAKHADLKIEDELQTDCPNSPSRTRHDEAYLSFIDK